MLKASGIPGPNISQFRAWELWMLYAVEPELEAIAKRAALHRRQRVEKRHFAYAAAKKAAWNLVGWYARDPRLRSHEAWDCFFRYILKELRL